MDGLIKSKKNGYRLDYHTNDVLEVILYINKRGNFNLNVEILRYMAIFHDIGKANPIFQDNMDKGEYDKICRHEICSILFMGSIPEKFRDIVGLSILSHHKSIRDDERSIYDLYHENTDKLNNNHISNISEWGEDVKIFLSKYFGIVINVPTIEQCKNIIEYYVDLIKKLGEGYSEYKGILTMADHFASCYIDKVERSKILDKLFNVPNIDYYCGRDNNYPLSLIESDGSKSHTFVIAPTGCGKTNFMLKRCIGRIFYILPFQASINAMYNRIKGDIGDDSTLITLLHASKAVVEGVSESDNKVSDFFGSSVKVLTPFQIFSIIYCLKGYEGIMMDLRGQDIILDEIHVYKGLNGVCVINLIKVLKYLGCRIHICSATIPKILYDEIISILGEGETQIVKLGEDTLSSFNRHIIHTIDKTEIDLDLVYERYNKGEKVLVVCNQVKRAIGVYCTLKGMMPSCKIMLIHSRYEHGRRNELESKLMGDFNVSDEPCIVVSTQVVEVSIDINFDVLMTECADIMSLIQRFGRVNRQRVNIGVYRDIFIYFPKDKISSLPYDYDIVMSTFGVLSEYDGKILEEKEIQGLINCVYNNASILKDSLSCPFNEITNDWKYKKYWHCANTSISSLMGIDGYVGILASKIGEYEETFDNGLEIPLSKPTDKVHNVKRGIYLVRDDEYNNELGYFKDKNLVV